MLSGKEKKKKSGQGEIHWICLACTRNGMKGASALFCHPVASPMLFIDEPAPFAASFSCRAPQFPFLFIASSEIHCAKGAADRGTKFGLAWTGAPTASSSSIVRERRSGFRKPAVGFYYFNMTTFKTIRRQALPRPFAGQRTEHRYAGPGADGNVHGCNGIWRLCLGAK